MSNKFQRLRAGVVPEWAKKDQEEKREEKVQYQGMTGDGAAVVVNVKYREEKIERRPDVSDDEELIEN